MVKRKLRKKVSAPDNSTGKSKNKELRNGCANESADEKEKGKALRNDCAEGSIDKKGEGKSLRNDCPDKLIDEKGKGQALGVEVQNNGVKRKKRKIAKSLDEKIEIKDYFSKLPEHIIHHIIGFLQSPKDVARTIILSKKWKTLWNSFPTFYFDQRCFKPSDEVKNSNRSQAKGAEIANFIRVVNKSLSTRLEAMSSIEKFKLHLSAYNGLLARPMNRWIQAALGKNVRELDIYAHRKGARYRLPQAVVSSKAITLLKLRGIEFDTSSTIKLYNLRVLSIKDSNLDENLIQNFVNCCPLIEDLRLVYCAGLSCLHVTTLAKLVRVEVHECSTLKKVEIHVPNLHTFWFHGWRNLQCEINLAGCGNLKNLTLKDRNLTEDLLEKQLSMFPKLEKLMLAECIKLRRIVIFSETIKRLSVIMCRKVYEVNLDAPHLISFEYTGVRMPLLSMNVLALHELKLRFEPLKDEIPLLMLKRFRGRENLSQGFKLFVFSGKDVTIYEELKGIQIRPSRKCKIELISSNILRDHAADRLLNVRPEVLSIVSPPNCEFLQFMREFINGGSKNPDCCRYYSFKCWRHYLEDVQIVEVNDDIHQTTFILKWKPKMVSDNQSNRDGNARW